jgi:acetyl-CoA synthetase
VTIEPNMIDYEAACREMKLDVPEFFNFTVDTFEKNARERGDKMALIFGGGDGDTLEKYTFEQLRRKVNRYCHVFNRLGIRKGDRILILMGWRHEWHVTLLAMIKLGIVAIPTTTQSRPRDLLYRFDASGSVGILCAPDLMEVVDAMSAESKTLRHKMVIGLSEPVSEGWIDFAAAASGSRPYRPIRRTRCGCCGGSVGHGSWI